MAKRQSFWFPTTRRYLSRTLKEDWRISRLKILVRLLGGFPFGSVVLRSDHQVEFIGRSNLVVIVVDEENFCRGECRYCKAAVWCALVSSVSQPIYSGRQSPQSSTILQVNRVREENQIWVPSLRASRLVPARVCHSWLVFMLANSGSPFLRSSSPWRRLPWLLGLRLVCHSHHITVLVAVASNASVATNLEPREDGFCVRLEGKCSSLALDTP